MFGKIAEAKKKAEEIKSKLEAITVEGLAGNGKVRVVATGNKTITEVHIDDELLNPERKNELQGLLLEAIGQAVTQAENVSQSEMQALMSSILPGGLGNLLK